MAVNLNSSPYYDDFDEEKNYQRVLFKPGVSVQSRELNQIQSVFHNSISKTADGIYGDGARITSSHNSITIADDLHGQLIRTVKLTGTGSNVSSYVGKFISGTTSNTVGLIRFAYSKNDPVLDDPTSLVIDVKSFKGLIEFSPSESVRIYSNYNDAFNRNSNFVATEVTDLDVTINATATAAAEDDEITFTSLSAPLKIGDILELPTAYNQDLVVTKILSSNSIRLSGTLKTDLVTSINMIFKRRNTCPTSIVSVSDGVYYKNGYYIKVAPQSIVPDKYTALPSKSVILKYSDSIVDYSSDESLLDPAFESSNYLAPGADRLKTELTIASVDLTSSNLPDTTDDHIEVVRFVDGKQVFVENPRNTLPLYLNNVLADRTYDESGNYEVQSFRLSPRGSSADDVYAKFHINAGKAVVGGQVIETSGPTVLNVPKSKTFNSLEDIFINANQDEYLVIDNPQFGYINPTKIRLYDVLECHSTNDRAAMSNSTLVGYLIVKHIVYDSGEGNNTRYRLYPYWYYQASSTLTIRDVRSFISKSNLFSSIGGNTGTYNDPKFFANVNATKGYWTDGKLYGYELGPRKRSIFPIDNKYLKNISNIRIYHSKLIENQAVTTSSVTVTLSGTEKFVGNAGTLSDDTKRRYYQVLVRSTSSGSLTAGQSVNIDEIDMSLNADKNILTVNLSTYLVTGAIDIYLTIYNSELPRKTKLLNVNRPTEPIRIVSADTPYSTYRSDIYALKAIYSIGSNVFHRDYNASITYALNDHVVKDGLMYRALSSSTGQPVTNTTYWEKVIEEQRPLYSFDNGHKDTHYEHALVTYKGNIYNYNPGNVVLILDYFSHSGSGVIDFTSYPTSIQNNIPIFRSEDGTQFDLRQCLDFRPKKNDTNVTANFWADNNSNTYVLPNPVLENALQLDFDYYQARIDRLYVTARNTNKDSPGFNFFLDKGIPDLYPKTPKDQSSKDKLLIATLVVPPFTKNSKDVSVFYNRSPRYTMADIQTIDQRLTVLEKRVKKQGLDIVALNNQVFEGGNTEVLLFKTGILVDDFSSVSPNDIRNPYSTCTVDTLNRELKPALSATSFNLFFEAEPDLNVEYDIVTMNVVGEESLVSVTEPTITKETTGNQTVTSTSSINPNSGGVKSTGTGFISMPDVAVLTTAGALALGKDSVAVATGFTEIFGGASRLDAPAVIQTLEEAGGSVISGSGSEALVEAGLVGAAGAGVAVGTSSLGIISTAATAEAAAATSLVVGGEVALAASAGSFIAGALEVIAGIFSFFSDEHLKKNIEKIYTHSSGINVYRYEKFGKEEVGVLAQELLLSHPQLVNKSDSGHYMVDYNKLSKILLG